MRFSPLLEKVAIDPTPLELSQLFCCFVLLLYFCLLFSLFTLSQDNQRRKRKNNFLYWTWFCHDEMERYFYCVWLMDVWWSGRLCGRGKSERCLLCLRRPDRLTLYTPLFPGSGRLNKKWCENCFPSTRTIRCAWTSSYSLALKASFRLVNKDIMWENQVRPRRLLEVCFLILGFRCVAKLSADCTTRRWVTVKEKKKPWIANFGKSGGKICGNLFVFFKKILWNFHLNKFVCFPS